MIASLRLKNFRCFEDHNISFRDFNVLLGANNAGKSTVVEALRLVSHVTERYNITGYRDVPQWTGLSGLYRGIFISLESIGVDSANILHRYNDPPAELLCSFSNGTSITIYIGEQGKAHAIIKSSQRKVIRTTTEAKKLSLPLVRIMPQAGPLRKDEKILSEEHVQRNLYSPLASSHFRNQLKVNNDYFPKFKALVEDTWPHTQIQSIEYPLPYPKEPIYLMVRVEDFPAEAGTTGHGFQMWMQLMWFLARTETAGTIVLDEPDVYMHPRLQRSVAKLLRGRNPQSILTTHSMEIVDEVQHDSIIVVDKTKKNSTFISSIPALQEHIYRLGSGHNLLLLKLAQNRRYIITEGEDFKLLEVYQQNLFPDSIERFNSLPHRSLHGSGGWEYAFSDNSLLTNILGEKIRAYFLLDRDYKTEREIQSRYEFSQKRGVELHVWSRKEFENYLLIPAVIARIIAENIVNKDAAPNETEVMDKMHEIANLMEDDAMAAFANEYLSEDKKAGLPTAVKKARARLNDGRRGTRGLLDMVSGKAVLRRIFDWSQLEFGVSLNKGQIVRYCQRDEIDPEIVEVVTAIEESRGFLLPENTRGLLTAGGKGRP